MDGLVYATDFGGSLWAVDAATGQIIWKNAIGSYTGVPGDVSRTTPAHWQGALIMGDGAQAANTQEGAIVFALDAKSGRPKWRTKVEADPAAMITSPPIVHGGVVFVGTASKAETQDRPTTFRGSVLALSADTGKILWQTGSASKRVLEMQRCRQHPGAYEFCARASVHRALEGFQTIDLPFGLAVAPTFGQRVPDCVNILPQRSNEALHRVEAGSMGLFEPRVEFHVAFASK